MEVQCNANLRKLLSAHTSHAIQALYQINSEIAKLPVSFRFVVKIVEAQAEETELRLQSVTKADVWWSRRRIWIAYSSPKMLPQAFLVKLCYVHIKNEVLLL